MIQWLIQMCDVELVGSGANIFLISVDQLAYNSIAKGELLRWNDTKRKPFASSFVSILTRDALCGRSQGCGFANEVAKG